MLYHVNLGFVAATQIEIIGSFFTRLGLVWWSWTVEHPINSSKTRVKQVQLCSISGFFYVRFCMWMNQRIQVPRNFFPHKSKKYTIHIWLVMIKESRI